jgi:RimJ/RimL family protein N-acetyltransferase
MRIEPVILAGRHVRLEPLAPAHADGLWEQARDPELWRWTVSKIGTRAAFDAYLATAFAEAAAGKALPFATVEAASGRPVGSTRFANISAHDRRVEIGWTWIGRPWQRTAVNTEAKLLMLGHAFDGWGCVRVELKTSSLNAPSRRAIARIGGVEEGTLRRHTRLDDGTWRDTVYFSILDHEWPGVRARLEARLAEPR